jgi:hypothetical protein
MKHNKSIWIVGAVGVLLLAGEGMARFMMGLGKPPLSVEHPTIEYLFKPNQDVSRFGNRIVINEYGMRSPDFPAQRSNPNELRIMVLGDSVINGGNLTDHDRLATTLLAQELANRRGVEVTVGNISAGSWGPGNWLAYAREYGFFDADAVVLVLSSHDYADNPKFKPLNPNTHPTRAPISALSEAFNRYLIPYSGKLLTSMTREVSNDSTSEIRSVDAAAIQQGLVDLEEFLLLAQEEGRKVVMILHPTREEMQSQQMQEGYYKLSDLAVQLNLPIISLSDVYKQSLANGIDIYRDDIHINDVGQQVLADVLLEVIP